MIEGEPASEIGPPPPGRGKGGGSTWKSQIIPYNPKLKDRARQLRKNTTRAERRLWRHLKGNQICGYDFDRQRPIDEYIVDFFCRELMLAIEIDGSRHDFIKELDDRRQKRLESFGVRFLRFWNYEVLNEMQSVLERIVNWISEHERKTHPPSPSQEGE